MSEMVKYKDSVLLKRPKSGPVYHHLWHSPFILGFGCDDQQHHFMMSKYWQKTPYIRILDIPGGMYLLLSKIQILIQFQEKAGV